MSRNQWRGDAKDVAQVSQFTVTGAGAANDTVIVTINRKTVTATVPAAPTTTTVAAAIAAACLASDIPEFKKIAWTSSGAVVYGTADTPGIPFTITSVTVTGTVTVGAVSTPTASAGHWHWDDPNNWSLGTAPAAGQDIDILEGDSDIRYGIEANAADTFASINVYSTYTGNIGLPNWNPDGYWEYLPTFLKAGFTVINIGVGQGTGSSLIKINGGTVQSTILVSGTGSPSTNGQPAFYFIGTNASNAATVNSGYAGFAFDLGTSCTLLSLKIGSSPGIPAVVYAGAGLTLTTFTTQGGTAYLLVGCTTLDIGNQGSVIVSGPNSCNFTTVSGTGGTLYMNAPGTISSLEVSGSLVDFSQDPRPKTVTRCTANAGSTIRDLDNRVTFTYPISCPDGVNAPGFTGGATLLIGKQITVQRNAATYLAPIIILSPTTISTSTSSGAVDLNDYPLTLRASLVAASDLAGGGETLAVKFTECDTSGGVYTDVAGGAFASYSPINTLGQAQSLLFTRTKRWVKAVLTITGGITDVWTVAISAGE